MAPFEIDYGDADVLEAAEKRVSAIFDAFERVVVSVSGGKDSTVIRDLALREAERRGRRVELFFLDQEAEYQSTEVLLAEWMRDPRVDPRWFQVPIRLTNATSHRDYWLRAWEPGASWVHPKDPVAIHALEEPYPDRFYEFFEWYEQSATVSTAFVVGLRAREAMTRYRTVKTNPGCHGWKWSTKTKNPRAFRVYPIYDWFFTDVWKYIADRGLRYNAHYDRMFAKHGPDERHMRVSNLIHEQAFRCLTDLQEFEPDTYERLVARLGGVHAAALYAGEAHVLDARALPHAFPTWRAYRDYLLASTPLDRIDRFHKRFEGQGDDEETSRRQCKQILTNDWEGNVPVTRVKKSELRAVWWDRL